MENRKDELDRFKSEINLGEYACEVHGFTFDKRQSSRCSAVVRHSNGDKLIITRRSNRHFVYFNAKGDDSGTILDFIQARRNISFGKIRQELRAWSSSGAVQRSYTSIQLEPSIHDASRVLKTWVGTDAVSADNHYLTNTRGIPSSTITATIFEGQIRTDSRRNILFAHRTLEGDLCGFEIKNRSFTGFSPGGVKSLFGSRSDPEANTAVFCETAIDVLSVASILGMKQRQFFSTAGQASSFQIDLALQSLMAMPALETVWLAFDNDSAGIRFSEQFEKRILVSLPRITVQTKLPPREGTDWNDELKQIRRSGSESHPTSQPR